MFYVLACGLTRSFGVLRTTQPATVGNSGSSVCGLVRTRGRLASNNLCPALTRSLAFFPRKQLKSAGLEGEESLSLSLLERDKSVSQAMEIRRHCSKPDLKPSCAKIYPPPAPSRSRRVPRPSHKALRCGETLTGQPSRKKEAYDGFKSYPLFITERTFMRAGKNAVMRATAGATEVWQRDPEHRG